MKKSTKKFIISFFVNELTAEYVQDNAEPLEIEYVRDLVDSAKDFVEHYGEWYDKYIIKEKIEQLIGEN